MKVEPKQFSSWPKKKAEENEYNMRNVIFVLYILSFTRIEQEFASFCVHKNSLHHYAEKAARSKNERLIMTT